MASKFFKGFAKKFTRKAPHNGEPSLFYNADYVPQERMFFSCCRSEHVTQESGEL